MSALRQSTPAQRFHAAARHSSSRRSLRCPPAIARAGRTCTHGPLSCRLPGYISRRSPRHQLKAINGVNAVAVPCTLPMPGRNAVQQVNVVYKFGGSSVRDADRMIEVADIICSFPDLLPAVVLSAMGKTTNNLLECGELALRSPTNRIADLPPLKAVRDLHLETCRQLNVERATQAEVERLLSELQQLLIGISIMQDLTARAKDSLVSFGERLSTRIFASFLRTRGVAARQYDAWDLGVTTTDDFTNAEVIYDATLPKVKAALAAAQAGEVHVPIVTGFLGRGKQTGAITTLGRGGSDLTATLLGAALDLKEVQVWKDVDGVLTSDPRIVEGTHPVMRLTYEEATELAYFGAQVLHPAAMQPAIRSGRLNVRVKNSYNRTAAGTIITKDRDMSEVLVTSIVLKQSVTLVDIISTRMLGQHGFLAKVFDVFREHRISVDVVATSEVSVSLTLDPRRIFGSDEEGEDRPGGLPTSVEHAFASIAQLSVRQGLSIISLISNIQRSSEVLSRVFGVLEREGINVVMMSQGASKTNISLVVPDCHGQRAVQALHRAFFGGDSS